MCSANRLNSVYITYNIESGVPEPPEQGAPPPMSSKFNQSPLRNTTPWRSSTRPITASTKRTYPGRYSSITNSNTPISCSLSSISKPKSKSKAKQPKKNENQLQDRIRCLFEYPRELIMLMKKKTMWGWFCSSRNGFLDGKGDHWLLLCQDQIKKANPQIDSSSLDSQTLISGHEKILAHINRFWNFQQPTNDIDQT